jgi:serralysin
MADQDYIIDLSHLVGCGCPACAGGFEEPAVLDASLDGRTGTYGPFAKPIWTPEEIAAHLNRTAYPGTTIGGPGWSNFGFDARPASGDPMVLRFGFHTAETMFAEPYVYRNAQGQLVGRPEFFGFQAFSEAQKAAAREAIGFWDDLIAIRFEETSASEADITFGNRTNFNGQAYAFLPYNYSPPSTKLAGDIWVNGLAASNLQLEFGYYGIHTLTHEIGHAVGLQHPGGYNAAPGLSITYPLNAEYAQDSRQYSVMSYFNAEFTGGGHIDWNRLNWVYAATPMVHDVLAVQAIYGADYTTRSGDTTYGFNSTADRDVFNFEINTTPVLTIWDGGGVDTLDFSGWNTPSKIDLNPGAFSSGGGSGVVPLQVLKDRGLLPASYTEEQYAALRARYNAPDGLLHDNIAIAYGAIIENAVGGGGNDIITGNGVSNVLKGNAGDDVISGLAGDDFLHGGDGADRLVGGDGLDQLWGGAGADTFVFGLEQTRHETKRGLASIDIVWDFDAAEGDKIDLSGLGLVWGGKGSVKAGAVTVQALGNVNAAENVLGFDLPDLEKGDKSKVSLVYADVDGDGEADIVIVLVGVRDVSAADVILG